MTLRKVHVAAIRHWPVNMTDFSIVIEIVLNFKNVEIITKRNNYSL